MNKINGDVEITPVAIIANSAIYDGSGNVIVDTYMTKEEYNNRAGAIAGLSFSVSSSNSFTYYSCTFGAQWTVRTPDLLSDVTGTISGSVTASFKTYLDGGTKSFMNNVSNSELLSGKKNSLAVFGGSHPNGQSDSLLSYSGSILLDLSNGNSYKFTI